MTETEKKPQPKKKRAERRPAKEIPKLRSSCSACGHPVEYDPWRSWVHIHTQAYSCRIGDRNTPVASPAGA